MKPRRLVVLSSFLVQLWIAPITSTVHAISCPPPKPSASPCYTVTCNTQEGEWIERALAVGTACSDGDPLTSNDRCYAPVAGSYERACVGVPFEAQVFNSLEKIKKGRDIVPSTAGATLYAAQNEFEAFQLAIEPRKAVSDFDVSIAPLAGPNGATLDFEIWREQYIYVSTPSGPDGGVGDWPDKLIPKVDTICSSPDGGCSIANYGAFPYSVGVGENVVAYAETFAGATQPPGDYYGTVTVSWWSSWGFRPTITFPVKVTVWPFRLPSTSSLKNYYIMYPGNLCSPDGLSAEVWPTGASPDESCMNLALRYAQFGLDHRLTVDPSINRQPTDPTRAEQFRASFASKFGPFFEGINPDGTPSRPSWTKLAGAKPSRVSPYPNNTPETFLATWSNVYSQYPVNQTPKWLARSFYYVCDEPHADTACTGSWPAVEQRADAAHSHGIATLVTTDAGSASASNALGATWTGVIDLITPNVISIQREGRSSYPAEFEADYAAYRPPFNQGTRRELWWYQACDSAGYGSTEEKYTGYPELAIDVTGVKNRAMQWMTRRFGMVGELYWDTVHAFPLFDQHTVIDSALPYCGLYGDGTLFYPGYNRPLPSLRLKHLRDGMEDYEYLQLVADRHCARGIAKHLVEHARAARDVAPEMLLEHRQYAADEIMAPGSRCPAAVSRECEVGWQDCSQNQVCVNLSTTINCGACGNRCPNGYACYRGACEAPSPGCPAHAPYDCGCGEPLVCKSDPRACSPCE